MLQSLLDLKFYHLIRWYLFIGALALILHPQVGLVPVRHFDALLKCELVHHLEPHRKCEELINIFLVGVQPKILRRLKSHQNRLGPVELLEDFVERQTIQIPHSDIRLNQLIDFFFYEQLEGHHILVDDRLVKLKFWVAALHQLEPETHNVLDLVDPDILEFQVVRVLVRVPHLLHPFVHWNVNGKLLQVRVVDETKDFWFDALGIDLKLCFDYWVIQLFV